MSNEKTYTAKDIHRYHKGEMSAAEMHLLEKAALDDPMLADALEGYTYTNTVSADVETLQSKLQQRVSQQEKKGKVIAFPPLLKIAAIFLLIAGAGWIVFQTFSGTDNNLAISHEEDSEIQKIQRPAATTDSMTVSGETIASDTLSGREEVVASQSTRSTTANVADNTATPTPLLQQKAEPTKDLQASTAPALADASEVKKEAATVQGNETFKERLVATNVKPQDDTIRNVNIVLRRTDVPVEEVVINRSKAQPRARKMPVVDTLEPERGWHSFDDYVAQNLNAPDEIKLKPINQGEVELSFQVDKEGNPVNITVTKSLCKKCDEEAVRLLKEGPKWKGRKTNGKVKIKF